MKGPSALNMSNVFVGSRPQEVGQPTSRSLLKKTRETIRQTEPVLGFGNVWLNIMLSPEQRAFFATPVDPIVSNGPPVLHQTVGVSKN